MEQKKRIKCLESYRVVPSVTKTVSVSVKSQSSRDCDWKKNPVSVRDWTVFKIFLSSQSFDWTGKNFSVTVWDWDWIQKKFQSQSGLRLNKISSLSLRLDWKKISVSDWDWLELKKLFFFFKIEAIPRVFMRLERWAWSLVCLGFFIFVMRV